jgi:hypothetical protein
LVNGDRLHLFVSGGTQWTDLAVHEAIIMSRVPLPSRLFNDRRIRGGHIRVMAAIGILGAGALSHREIGAQSGIGDRELRRHLLDLSEMDYISVANKDGAKNTYAILFNDLGEGIDCAPEGSESPPEGRKITLVPSPLPPQTPLTPHPSTSEPKGSSETTRARELAAEMVSAWREECGDVLSVPAKLDPTRIAGCDARWKDSFGRDLEQWRSYCRRIRGSPFCCGDNDRGWRADFDWALKPKTIRGALEGKYERRLPPRKATSADNLIEGFGRAAGLRTPDSEPDREASGPLLDGEYARLSA